MKAKDRRADAEAAGARPAFEVTEPGGKVYRIWADGRVEGFAPGAIICNRIPTLAAAEARAAMDANAAFAGRYDRNANVSAQVASRYRDGQVT